MADILTDDAEFERQYQAATRLGQEKLAREPRAKTVIYDEATNRIRIELSNGCTFMFPPDLAQGLRGATAEQLSDVEIFGSGLDVNWRTLDAQFEVAHLLTGIFGTKRWMSELGSTGAKSEATSSRENGARGGRPRKAA